MGAENRQRISFLLTSYTSNNGDIPQVILRHRRVLKTRTYSDYCNQLTVYWPTEHFFADLHNEIIDSVGVSFDMMAAQLAAIDGEVAQPDRVTAEARNG